MCIFWEVLYWSIYNWNCGGKMYSLDKISYGKNCLGTLTDLFDT